MERVIHTRVVIDMATGTVLEDEYYLYDGPVAECGGGGGKGGGSSTTVSVDKEYNSRMATLAEEQQDWAREYYDMWQKYYEPYEIKQAQANLEVLPLETSLYKSQLQNLKSLSGSQSNALKELFPKEKDLYSAQLSAAQTLLPQQTTALTNFMNAAAKGVDVNERMALAQADVANAWQGTQAATNRALARMGVNPNSGRFAGVQAVQDATKAEQMAGARTQARVGAEEENYKRLAQAAAVNPVSSILTSAKSPVSSSDILQGINILRE